LIDRASVSATSSSPGAASSAEPAAASSAYEKGKLFLRMLEQVIGRERFDRFVRPYFDTFAFQSMDTRRFLDYLKQNLFSDSDEKMKELQVDQWVYGPGVPSNAPQLRSAAFDKARPGYHSVSRNTVDEILDWRG
jgi:leukotriene-A4 hydrolase